MSTTKPKIGNWMAKTNRWRCRWRWSQECAEGGGSQIWRTKLSKNQEVENGGLEYGGPIFVRCADSEDLMILDCVVLAQYYLDRWMDVFAITKTATAQDSCDKLCWHSVQMEDHVSLLLITSQLMYELHSSRMCRPMSTNYFGSSDSIQTFVTSLVIL